jgi:hypothetical protein
MVSPMLVAVPGAPRPDKTDCHGETCDYEDSEGDSDAKAAGRRPAMALRMSMSTNSASSLSHRHLLRNEAGPWRSPR